MTSPEPRNLPRISLTEHMSPLLRYAKKLTQNPETAQDLVQETMVLAIQHENRIAACDRPDRYLAIMLRNLNTSHHRKRCTEPVKLQTDELALASGDAPAPALQTYREVLEAVRTLPDLYAEILLLSAYEGLSYRELAERLRIPLGTVMSRLHRARHLLRHTIDLDDNEIVCDIFAT